MTAGLQPEELTYTVKLGDNLWTLAEKYLGSGAAFPAIARSTNKKATEDETFAYISNPDLIYPGWKLLIPSAEAAAEYLDTYASKPVAGAPTEITLLDTNSGASFQKYWQETVIPQIQADLGIKINYQSGGHSLHRAAGALR